ncbi:MAG TPA: ribonuclease P protein component [Vicinamibacterales bacterium]|jgi:ribonuclease P protein component|nr:ribonuclease P protein component [Vicinamibacterales bacterium]
MQRFRPAQRICRRAEYQQIYAKGSRISGKYWTLFAVRNDRAPAGRLGIAATRKFGGAVSRNRAKRLIREVFRRNRIAAGYDVVVVPKRALLDIELDRVEAEYAGSIQRLKTRTRAVQ